MLFQINVAKDFSEWPMGRYKNDGNASGERFRDDLLVPKLKELINYNTQSINKEKLYVVFEGVTTAGGSWLEEVFGGIIRETDIRPFGIFDLIEIVDRGESSSIKDSVREYMDDEIKRQLSKDSGSNS